MKNKSICIIPARGGSKRIPKKNIKEFFGKPLIAYSIEVALESKLFDKVIVSTDDEQIAKISKQYGAKVPFIRPPELSDDFTGTGDVVNHAVEYLENQGESYDYICTIYATAPLLQEKYLIEGYEKLKNSDAKMAFSVTSMPFPIQRTFKLNSDGRCEMFTPEHFMTRSQDLDEAYQDAGQFYWENRSKEFTDIPFGKDSIPIILPRYLVQDIDTLEDWERAEYMYKAINQNTFDLWNNTKQTINDKDKVLKFRERDIFFMSVGQNIGYETYGKGTEYLRPVLVVRKFNNRTFMGVPLSSKLKDGKYYYEIEFKNRKNIALLSQLRSFDMKRAKYFVSELSEASFLHLKEKLSEIINPSKNEGSGHAQKSWQNCNNIISKEEKHVK
jgi:N-acylneuraminate cytidylyltransferase